MNLVKSFLLGGLLNKWKCE